MHEFIRHAIYVHDSRPFYLGLVGTRVVVANVCLH